MEAWFTQNLVCPRDQLELNADRDELVCPQNHRYPVVDGVPVMLVDDVPETMQVFRKSMASARDPAADRFYIETLGIVEEEKQGILKLAATPGWTVDPVVSYLVGATNGIAYVPLIGKLKEYPIPELRLPPGEGKSLLDIGCSWGRWSIAAAKKGYRPTGIDPSLGAVMAARRVSRQLGVDARFLVGDARFLPFKNSSFDCVFSYSVIQHFSRADAAAAVAQVGRVLAPGGNSLIQMPTKLGVRCLYHQARRRFREAQGFEVRYWSLPALRKLFTAAIGPSSFSVDCYFGIGLQYSDRHLLPGSLKVAVGISERLRRMSRYLPMLRWVADSVYVTSIKGQIART